MKKQDDDIVDKKHDELYEFIKKLTNEKYIQEFPIAISEFLKFISYYDSENIDKCISFYENKITIERKHDDKYYFEKNLTMKKEYLNIFHLSDISIIDPDLKTQIIYMIDFKEKDLLLIATYSDEDKGGGYIYTYEKREGVWEKTEETGVDY